MRVVRVCLRKRRVRVFSEVDAVPVFNPGRVVIVDRDRDKPFLDRKSVV